MSVDDQADLRSTRKRLSVTGKTPALSVCEDGYVRVGLSSDMRENDMLVLGLYLSLRNEKWKKIYLIKFLTYSWDFFGCTLRERSYQRCMQS